MKQIFIAILIFPLLVCGTGGVPILFAAQDSKELPWNEQLGELGYLLLHLSSINVINGLNLTREQAIKLRKMARQIESFAPESPSGDGKLSPEVEEIRRVYLELREVLLRNEEVTPELRQRVTKVRAQESGIIRATLRPARPVKFRGVGTRSIKARQLRVQCDRCHLSPSSGRRTMNLAANNRSVRKLPRNEEKDAFLAHFVAVFGQRGLVAAIAMSHSVDAILTDSQKSVIDSFACCLIPPKELSDPVRAGQADSSERELTLLRHARGVPETVWPKWRNWILGIIKRGLVIKNPGVSDREKKKVCARIAAVMEKARRLSDMEFEIEKESLRAELKGTPDRKVQRQKVPYKSALFLLIPGAAEAYNEVIKRLDDRGN